MQLLQILVSTFLLNHSIKSIVNSSKLRVKMKLFITFVNKFCDNTISCPNMLYQLKLLFDI